MIKYRMNLQQWNEIEYQQQITTSTPLHYLKLLPAMM